MLEALLRDNDINVETFNVRAYADNIGSIQLIEKFNPRELGVTEGLHKMVHFQLDNPSYSKKIHR